MANRLCLCSYPAFLIEPAGVGDEVLKKLSKSHKRSRFPAITWRHPANKALLLRSSTVDTSLLHAFKGVGKGLAVATTGQAASVDSEQGPDRVASHAQAHKSSTHSHMLASQAAATDSSSAWERYVLAVTNATPGIATATHPHSPPPPPPPSHSPSPSPAAAASTSASAPAPGPGDWPESSKANLLTRPHCLDDLTARSRDFSLIDLLLHAYAGPTAGPSFSSTDSYARCNAATLSNAQFTVYEFPEGFPRSESLHSATATLDSPTSATMVDSRVMMNLNPTSLATGEDLELPDVEVESGTPSPVLAHRQHEESVSVEGDSMLCEEEAPRRSPPAGTTSAGSGSSQRSRLDSALADERDGDGTLERTASMRADAEDSDSASEQVGEEAFRRDAVRVSSRSMLETIGHRSRQMVSRAGRALGRASRSLNKQSSSSECPRHRLRIVSSLLSPLLFATTHPLMHVEDAAPVVFDIIVPDFYISNRSQLSQISKLATIKLNLPLVSLPNTLTRRLVPFSGCWLLAACFLLRSRLIVSASLLLLLQTLCALSNLRIVCLSNRKRTCERCLVNNAWQT